MLLRKLYLQLWGENFLHRLDSPARFKLYQATLGYCFRYVGANDFAALLVRYNKLCAGNHANAQLRTWARDNLLYNGYLMRNIKFFLFAVSTRKDKTVAACATRFGIHLEDTCITQLVDPEWARDFAKIRAAQSELNLYCMDSYNKLLERVWYENSDWVARYSWRKLLFIAQSTGTEVDDIKHELMIEALRAVNHVWPKIPCELYAHNLFKRTAHNVGMNLIKRANSQKHARLVRDCTGWRRLDVDYEGFSNNPDNDVALSVDHRPDLELRVDVLKFLENLSTKKRLFVESLIGTQLELCDWLQQQKLIHPHQDNEDLLQAKGLTEYLKIVCMWIGIEYRQARDFLNHIRNHFETYHAKPL